jgi:hypothetical protein
MIVWSLIRDNLDHLNFELKRRNPNLFRIAKEAHLCLYRTMLAALRGSSDRVIKGKNIWKDGLRYQLGRNPWKVVRAVKVPRCNRAWRFSEPVECEAPILNDTPLEEWLEEGRKLAKARLIGFLDCMAMVQLEFFMCAYVDSKPIKIEDDEMRMLEWLHVGIRNEYEHFSFDSYAAKPSELVTAARLCARLTYGILWESGAVMASGGVCRGLRRRVWLAERRLNLIERSLSG